MKVSLSARNLFRAAKRHKLNMKADMGYYNCAMGMAAAAAGTPLREMKDLTDLFEGGPASIGFARLTGRPCQQLLDLEAGYEDFAPVEGNRYRRAGKKLRQMILDYRREN
jgi:hypothetical protein